MQANKIVTFALAVGIIIVPSISLGAGAETSSAPNTSAKSDSSRYGKSSQGRFQEAKNLINQQRFSNAYTALSSLPMKSKDEADRQNLLGFSARKYGKLDEAATHYDRALEINPKHRGALEYQGELFLMLGQIEKARNNLKLLKAECWLGCAEVSKLEKAIEEFES